MMENKERNWAGDEDLEAQNGGSAMKNATLITYATSAVSYLADLIGTGITRFMTAGILGTLAILILAAPATSDVPVAVGQRVVGVDRISKNPNAAVDRSQVNAPSASFISRRRI